jgi:hypothetical protein
MEDPKFYVWKTDTWLIGVLARSMDEACTKATKCLNDKSWKVPENMAGTAYVLGEATDLVLEFNGGPGFLQRMMR